MKNRPRRIERQVASELSAFFARIGLPEVKRIPIIGRTGPDIEINEFGLIVDVKSRLSVPTCSFPGTGTNNEFAWTTLGNLKELTTVLEVSDAGKSKMAKEWLDHMDEWACIEYPRWRKDHGENRFRFPGISAIVMHKAAKPKDAKMPVGQSVFIMYRADLETFALRYANINKEYAKWKQTRPSLAIK